MKLAGFIFRCGLWGGCSLTAAFAGGPEAAGDFHRGPRFEATVIQPTRTPPTSGRLRSLLAKPMRPASNQAELLSRRADLSRSMEASGKIVQFGRPAAHSRDGLLQINRFLPRPEARGSAGARVSNGGTAGE